MTSTTQDTANTEADQAAEQSSVNKDAIWRLPVTVCRITDFLGEQTSNALLERAITTASGTLTPATLGDDCTVNRAVRRSQEDHHFAVPELMAAIDEVIGAVEHTLGVCAKATEPRYSLNVYNDGDFFVPHQDSWDPSAQG
ncbi:hypothetical protein [Streptomyces shenzhenensis]|uniref:hypothetical protein n=1 Tax=Streptomyces shenzhenensis TaxID=943815 RepID=UPI0015F03F9C|nr:hypothetical protein [Streptomyces shenzhenensis]